jgi:hypothetical protein
MFFLKTKVPTIFWFTIILICELGCSKNKIAKIRRVNLVYHLPTVNWDNSITDIHNEYDVYYYKDLVMYELPYTFDSTVNGKHILHEQRRFFFIVQKDSVFGYLYNLNHLKPFRASVDSTLEKKTFKTNIYDTLARIKANSSFIDNKGDFIRVFNPPSTKNDPTSYTLYFHYSKELNNIPETFSVAMDNVKNRKLIKIRIVAHAIYREAYKIIFPEREIYYEMTAKPVSDPASILGLFNLYYNSIKREK